MQLLIITTSVSLKNPGKLVKLNTESGTLPFSIRTQVYGRLRVVALGMASLLGSRPFVYVHLAGTTSGLSLRCAIPIPVALTLILITPRYSSR